MYATYFGLREPPFAITPDPSYVYLSPHHQEALAHLLYGTHEDGGFVQLTGEVGTGKTTLIRALLEQRLDEVDIALCLNPRLTVVELLATVCDELGVSYSHEQQTLKPLLDTLNKHLLQSHTAGRRTVLIIDEAQNLSREVLEQIRLLTNLETTKHKLLRIILVGQPELRRLLARPDLRQLAQRITARHHLSPLGPWETAAYINHRLRVAGGHAALFAAGTRRMIYRYSGGIPRLINVLCDRALLGAYTQSTRCVTTRMVRRAAREALRGDNRKNWISAFYSKPQPAKPATSRTATGSSSQRRIRPGLMLASGLMGLSLIGLGFWLPHTPQTPAVALSSDAAADRVLPKSPLPKVEPLIASAPPSAPPSVPPNVPSSAPSSAPSSTPISPTVAATPDLLGMLRQNRGDDSNQQLLAIWGITQQIPKTKVAFCEWVKTQNLRCLMGQDDWNMLRRFNHPAVLQLTVGGRPASVLLKTLVGDTATLEIAGQTLAVPLAQLTPLWNGQYLLLWRSQIDLLLIGPGNTGEAVLWLRRRLALAAGQAAPEPLSATFDKTLGEQLRTFQRDQGLQADGMAGGRTLVLLNNLALTPDTPVLNPAAQDR